VKKISTLEPKLIWSYFDEITKIPRPSKKEEKIRRYIMEFGEKNKLNVKTDDAGNIVISKPATKGMENKKTVILQSHMDMVCEKNSDKDFNFDEDAIETIIDGNWVKADGTTLGADDGIGIAAQLAVLAADNITHGPLECLFTIDEETGLTGANNLGKNMLEGKILINLDSEDEGELFIGCAGGIDTLATLRYKEKPVPQNHQAFKISVTGLKGGHSGDDINKNRGNAIKMLTRIVLGAVNTYQASLHSFHGGNLRNAIPREAFALITIPADQVYHFNQHVKALMQTIKKENKENEPALVISAEPQELPQHVMNRKAAFRILEALNSCFNGVLNYSIEIPDLVETSSNLASVKINQDDNTLLVTTSQRSSVDSMRMYVASVVAGVFKLAKGKIKHTDGYPGWTPDKNSEILHITEAAYAKLFHQKPLVRAIHAGLECGLFLEKYPDLDMISFGPTIRGAHSPDERIDIKTTQKFWDLLLEVLAAIPES